MLELVDRNPLCTIIPSATKARLVINDGLLPLSANAQALLDNPSKFQRSAFSRCGTMEDLRHVFETSPVNAIAYTRWQKGRELKEAARSADPSAPGDVKEGTKALARVLGILSHESLHTAIYSACPSRHLGITDGAVVDLLASAGMSSASSETDRLALLLAVLVAPGMNESTLALLLGTSEGASSPSLRAERDRIAADLRRPGEEKVAYSPRRGTSVRCSSRSGPTVSLDVPWR